jgi:hypothetical protein
MITLLLKVTVTTPHKIMISLLASSSDFSLSSVLFCVLSYSVFFCVLSYSSQSHNATDSQSVSKSCCGAPSGVHDQIFITVSQLRSCFCGAHYLTRGQVCLLYTLLVLASAVFLGSESLVTCDYILLPQIWYFPFRRLLRLTGSRWRYSTPPPHGYSVLLCLLLFNCLPEVGSGRSVYYSYYALSI